MHALLILIDVISILLKPNDVFTPYKQRGQNRMAFKVRVGQNALKYSTERLIIASRLYPPWPCFLTLTSAIVRYPCSLPTVLAPYFTLPMSLPPTFGLCPCHVTFPYALPPLPLLHRQK